METTSAPYMIFFSGTSAVGKTEALDHLISVDSRFVRVPMTARAEREKLGNPSWESLEKSRRLATEHQSAVFNGFKTIIENAVDNHDGKHQVFERALIDTSGYSYAFGCDQMFILQQQALAHVIDAAISRKRRMLLVYFSPWKDHPYAVDQYRPPEHIRNRCETHLDKCMRNHPNQSLVPLMLRGDRSVSLDQFVINLKDKMQLNRW